MNKNKFNDITNFQNRLSFNEIDITKPPSETFMYGQRLWLKNRGKQQFINFSDHALLELRKYFNSLDQEKNGSIGVQELQDPFIAFGLSQTRKDVQQLIRSVDLDGSGKIQFDQFLAIMLKIKRGNSNGQQNNSAMFDFFQKLSNGNLGDDFDKNMSFKLNVNQFRRKKLLQSIMSSNKQKKQKGTKIMQNFQKQVLSTNQLKDVLYESKKSNIFLYGFQTKNKNKK